MGDIYIHFNSLRIYNIDMLNYYGISSTNKAYACCYIFYFHSSVLYR